MRKIIAYFDCWPVSGAKIGMAVSVRISDEWGRDDLYKRLEKLEAQHGPLFVKHLGLGYLSIFEKGQLKVGVTL